MKTKTADHKHGPAPKTPPIESELSSASAPSVSQGPSAVIKFKRILVPIDFSECSLLGLDYAVALGQQFQAKLILLHVVEPAVYQENYFGVNPPVGEANQDLLEAGRRRLAALAHRRAERSLDIETLVRIGRAHSEIPDTARAMGADMIVVGTHGFTGMEHLLMGSTAERVVRHAPCPVLTVRLPGTEPSKGN